ncbi:MAG: acetyl-CoA carboxylase biotin carboxyl carrier protein [Acidobacteriota bacterium]
MTIEEIKNLLDLFHSSGVAEMEVQRGENRVRFRRAPEAQEFAIASAPPIAVARPAVAPSASAEPVVADASLTTIPSPIVGTFYESPSPDKPAFVKVGDEVTVGQVLCIIESMKLMNEIEAEVAGVITARLVENGKAVEYGQPLFSIRPR